MLGGRREVHRNRLTRHRIHVKGMEFGHCLFLTNETIERGSRTTSKRTYLEISEDILIEGDAEEDGKEVRVEMAMLAHDGLQQSLALHRPNHAHTVRVLWRQGIKVVCNLEMISSKSLMITAITWCEKGGRTFEGFVERHVAGDEGGGGAHGERIVVLALAHDRIDEARYKLFRAVLCRCLICLQRDNKERSDERRRRKASALRESRRAQRTGGSRGICH